MSIILIIDFFKFFFHYTMNVFQDKNQIKTVKTFLFVDNTRYKKVLQKKTKTLQRVLYNGLYKYLTTEKLLQSKQFGFQTGLSTEHAIVKLVDQIYKSFEKDHYTLGVFIDLSKAFDTVDHTILIRKLEMYVIKGINFPWFRSYLTNKISYTSMTHDLETDTKNICCGVPQGSILGPLLFLLYVSDLHNSSALDPIMFADDKNLFFEHKGLKTLCSLVNQELQKINEWFEKQNTPFSINQVEKMIFLSYYLGC